MGAVKRSCRDATSGTCAHKVLFVSARSISQKVGTRCLAVTACVLRGLFHEWQGRSLDQSSHG